MVWDPIARDLERAKSSYEDLTSIDCIGVITSTGYYSVFEEVSKVGSVYSVVSPYGVFVNMLL